MVEKTLQVLEKMRGGYVTSSVDRKTALTTAIAIIKAAQELEPLLQHIDHPDNEGRYLPEEHAAAKDLLALLSPDPKPQQEVSKG